MSLRFLVVFGNTIYQTRLTGLIMISLNGASPTTAHGSKEGLEIFESANTEPFNVVIIDIDCGQTPEENGLWLARKIREIDKKRGNVPQTPIIFMTSDPVSHAPYLTAGKGYIDLTRFSRDKLQGLLSDALREYRAAAIVAPMLTEV